MASLKKGGGTKGADLKKGWLTADLKKMGEQKSIDNVTRDIIKRDYKDSTRKHSPLIKSENAIIIDTSNLDINKVIDKIVNIVNKKGH